MEDLNVHNIGEPITLSRRLERIAAWILPHGKVADIGGDHGWLLLSVAKKGLLDKGIVGEINNGPYENADKRIQAYGFNHLIDVRLGDGLSTVQEGEVDQVVIAGMGGSLIASILDAGKTKLGSVKRLVLQPNIGGHRVRQWLVAHGWRLVHEEIIRDADIYYEMIVAEPGVEKSYQGHNITIPILEQIGPLLWRNRDPLLQEKMAEELAHKRKVLQQLSKGQSLQAINRRKELEQEIETWEQVIKWLSEEQN